MAKRPADEFLSLDPREQDKDLQLFKQRIAMALDHLNAMVDVRFDEQGQYSFTMNPDIDHRGFYELAMNARTGVYDVTRELLVRFLALASHEEEGSAFAFRYAFEAAPQLATQQMIDYAFERESLFSMRSDHMMFLHELAYTVCELRPDLIPADKENVFRTFANMYAASVATTNADLDRQLMASQLPGRTLN